MIISVDSSKTTAANWIKSQSYSFTEWGWDSGKAIFGVYNDFNGNNSGIPQSFIVDADGNVRSAFLGGITNPLQLTQVIDELI